MIITRKNVYLCKIKTHNVMVEIKNAMDYDIAVDLVNMMKMMASRKKEKATTQEEWVKQQGLINMYCYEEGVLMGRNGDDQARASLYDKAFNMYSPIVKKAYGTKRSSSNL